MCMFKQRFASFSIQTDLHIRSQTIKIIHFILMDGKRGKSCQRGGEVMRAEEDCYCHAASGGYYHIIRAITQIGLKCKCCFSSN